MQLGDDCRALQDWLAAAALAAVLAAPALALGALARRRRRRVRPSGRHGDGRYHRTEDENDRMHDLGSWEEMELQIGGTPEGAALLCNRCCVAVVVYTC